MSTPARLEPNPYAFKAFTDYEIELMKEQPLTVLEILFEQVKICKIFDYEVNNVVVKDLLENLKGFQNFPALKQMAFQCCLYIFTHDIKFRECQSVNELNDFISKEMNNKFFSLKQKKQLTKHFNSMIFQDDDLLETKLGEEQYWFEGECREH
jgi:hypothetical protein